MPRNFSDEELLQAIDTAHIYGKKLYLTVNTLLKNKELYEELISVSSSLITRLGWME